MCTSTATKPQNGLSLWRFVLLNKMNTSHKTCNVMLNTRFVIKLLCSKDRVSFIACLNRVLLSLHRGIFKWTTTRRHLEKRETVQELSR